MKNTLCVNLFAGPGCGKSTNAALLYGKLKNAGINIEYVSEFAKDLVWEERHKALSFQPYITAKQMYKIYRLLGMVEVIITDSPILLGILFTGPGVTDSFSTYVLDIFSSYNNYNIFLKRNNRAHKWNPKGRIQSEQEAAFVDLQILNILHTHEIPYEEVPIWEGELTANYLVDKVLRKLG
ncbi:MAG TPA: AAA family ATPase [Methylomirabilota bacterium]|nr:AAA family ATPase [Methylomirabilota bacterium]